VSKFKTTKELYNWIKKNRSTLPFCPRWNTKSAFSLKELLQHNVLIGYPALTDISGSKVAQFEHTVYIGENKTEVLSLGDDY
jgi:methionyl aminopeptidase